jgi:hypothetical protein
MQSNRLSTNMMLFLEIPFFKFDTSSGIYAAKELQQNKGDHAFSAIAELIQYAVSRFTLIL